MAIDYELRNLKSDDIFIVSQILSKIGVKELKASFTSERIKELSSGKVDTTALGFNIMVDVADLVLKNLPSCQNEIYTFLASLTGMTVKAIADLPMVDFTEMVIAVIQKDEFRDFFKVVAKLFK